MAGSRAQASSELKLLFLMLLLRYEFKFWDGLARPRSVIVDEFLFADPSGEVVMRKCKDAFLF